MFFNPEEFVRQQQMQMAEASDMAHRINEFIRSQDKDGLVMLSSMMRSIENDEKLPTYWAGLITGLIEERHNVCPVHGVNHMEDAIRDLTDSFTEEGSTFQGDTNEGDSEVDGTAQEFRVNVLEDGRVQCINCGYLYPNLADRKLRGPDDCPGCEVKAKFG